MKTFAAVLLLAAAASARNLRVEEPRGIRPRFDSRDAKIVGGSDAVDGQIPYQVYYNFQQEGSIGTYICGGSVLNAKQVLTAAHCCQNTYNMVVYAGGLNRNNLDQRRNAVTATQHPSYRATSSSWDACILDLDSEWDLDDPTRVAAIPSVAAPDTAGDHYAGMTARVSGWGTTSSGGSTSLNLQYVDVTIASDEVCREESLYGRGAITDDMMCAGSRDGGEDSCQGDSGGPLVINGDGNPADDVQVGIVSWGVSCAAAPFPGVYSDIAFIRTTTTRDFHF